MRVVSAHFAAYLRLPGRPLNSRPLRSDGISGRRFPRSSELGVAAPWVHCTDSAERLSSSSSSLDLSTVTFSPYAVLRKDEGPQTSGCSPVTKTGSAIVLSLISSRRTWVSGFLSVSSSGPGFVASQVALLFMRLHDRLLTTAKFSTVTFRWMERKCSR